MMVSIFESLVLRDLSGRVQNSGLMEMVWVAVSGPQTCATSRSRFFMAGVQPVALSVPGDERTKFLGASCASTAFTADRPIITLWRAVSEPFDQSRLRDGRPCDKLADPE